VADSYAKFSFSFSLSLFLRNDAEQLHFTSASLSCAITNGMASSQAEKTKVDGIFSRNPATKKLLATFKRLHISQVFQTTTTTTTRVLLINSPLPSQSTALIIHFYRCLYRWNLLQQRIVRSNDTVGIICRQRHANWKVYRVDPRTRTRDRRTRPLRVLEPRSRYEEVGRSSSEPVVTVPTRDVVNTTRERIHLRAEGMTASRRS